MNHISLKKVDLQPVDVIPTAQDTFQLTPGIICSIGVMGRWPGAAISYHYCCRLVLEMVSRRLEPQSLLVKGLSCCSVRHSL